MSLSSGRPSPLLDVVDVGMFTLERKEITAEGEQATYTHTRHSHTRPVHYNDYNCRQRQRQCRRIENYEYLDYDVTFKREAESAPRCRGCGHVYPREEGDHSGGRASYLHTHTPFAYTTSTLQRLQPSPTPTLMPTDREQMAWISPSLPSLSAGGITPPTTRRR
ncbi:hypothetical protein B0H34DRAFT_801253 [Crassisporium funariophilum]|nr:hypothetical protein B0H34DRAFT_801253 [Crassisporium funariophilum]